LQLFNHTFANLSSPQIVKVFSFLLLCTQLLSVTLLLTALLLTVLLLTTLLLTTSTDGPATETPPADEARELVQNVRGI